MKLLITILAFAIISCNKENSKSMSEETQPLKVIPTASVNGKTITLTADKSTGSITSYGWALDVSSPTYADASNPITITPLSRKAAKDGDGKWVLPLEFKPATATVTKAGKYAFSLMVYDTDGKQYYATVEMEVK